MSETKHTPGPWEAERTIPGWRIGPSYGLVCAICQSTDSGTHERQEANAHLIAAAPEMLQILKDTRDFLEMEGFEKCATSAIDSVIAQATNKKE